jgi:hypothetical protein
MKYTIWCKLNAVLIAQCLAFYSIAQDCFDIGSTKTQVRSLQGTPSSVSINGNSETWSYQLNHITFTNGKVTSYYNGSNFNKETILKICGANSANNISAEKVKTSNATKEETEKWIISKLEKYTSTYMSTYNIGGATITNKYGDYKFIINDGFLVINYTDERSEFYPTKPLDESKMVVFVYIPINDLREIINLNKGFSRPNPQFQSSANLHFYTITNSIITSNNKDKTSSFKLDFDFRAEENLESRLNSALICIFCSC